MADLSCKVCGVELVYSGTGRKPAYCETHRPAKNVKGDKKPTSRKNAARYTDAALRAELLGMVQGVGAVVLTIDRFDGAVIISGADGLVDAIMSVAAQNPSFRRWLEQGSSSVTWLQLAIAVGAVAIPIAAHHKVLPIEETAALRMFHPNLAAAVVPAPAGPDVREDTTTPGSYGADAA